MARTDLLGNNRIEDVRWLCSLSDSEIDLLISLKMMAIKRAKVIHHDALAKIFDLRMLRALSFVLMEHLKGQVADLSVVPGMAEDLSGCNLLKSTLDDKFATMSIEELRAFVGTDKRKRLAEMFGEDVTPNPKKTTGGERTL